MPATRNEIPRSRESRRGTYPSDVSSIELEPEQPEQVGAAVERLLAAAAPGAAVDPWWQAGNNEALADPFAPDGAASTDRRPAGS